MSQRIWKRSLASVLACGVLVVAFAPTSVTAKGPKPLPGSSGGEGESKCKQCDDEYSEKAATCMDAYERCQVPCPACTTRANCENRKPCMAPCNIKFAKCKDEAFKEREQCVKGC